MHHRIVTLVACIVLPALAAIAQAQQQSTVDYDYYVSGPVDAQGVALDAQVPVPAQQVIVLEGGDADVKDAFAWMIERAGGGNFVVLRASGSDGYHDWVFRRIGGVASVETIVTKTAAGADDAFVIDRIDRADAIFVAGGDQSDYELLWRDSALLRALQRAVTQRRVPIGGTSAGMVMLSGIAFAARAGTINSTDALANIDDPRIDLVDGLIALPALAATVSDSHIVRRDRMGRLVAFMGRAILDRQVKLADARAIGVEAKTALLIEGDLARVEGPGAVYFLRPLGAAPMRCDTPANALAFRNVQVQRIDTKQQTFDLAGWSPVGDAMATYDVSAECGVMTSSQGGSRLY